MPAYADPTPTPISADTIFLAFELSGTSWLVALHAPDADKVERHRLSAGVAAEVLGLIARTKARVTRRLGTTPAVNAQMKIAPAAKKSNSVSVKRDDASAGYVEPSIRCLTR